MCEVDYEGFEIEYQFYFRKATPAEYKQVAIETGRTIEDFCFTVLSTSYDDLVGTNHCFYTVLDWLVATVAEA